MLLALHYVGVTEPILCWCCPLLDCVICYVAAHVLCSCCRAYIVLVSPSLLCVGVAEAYFMLVLPRMYCAGVAVPVLCWCCLAYFVLVLPGLYCIGVAALVLCWCCHAYFVLVLPCLFFFGVAANVVKSLTGTKNFVPK